MTYDAFEDQATIQRISTHAVDQAIADRRGVRSRLKRRIDHVKTHHLEWLVGVPLGLLAATITVLILYGVLVS